MTEPSATCAYSGLRSLASLLEEQEQQEHRRLSDLRQQAPAFTEEDRDRIIQMAWEDRTPFEAIEFQFRLKEKDVIEFMRKHLRSSSFRLWRRRMKARHTKHATRRDTSTLRFKSDRQRGTGNRIEKR